MEKNIYKIYHICGGVLVALFVILFLFFKLDVREQETKDGYEILTQYEKITQNYRIAPRGIRQLYSFTLEGVDEAYCQLMFYSSHQNVKIYLDDECIYSMAADEIDMSGRSPGHVWNRVSFSEENNGKEVRIELTPLYESSIDIVPTFFLGNESDVMQDIVLKGLPIIILGLAFIVIGIIYIAFILYSYQKSQIEKNLLMLGYFAIQVGLWKITDSEAVNLLFPGRPVLSQLPYMALMLMCVTFTLYIKELYSTSGHGIWSVPIWAGFINMGLNVMFQYFGIADMRQMLPVTHAVIGIIAVVVAVMTIREVRTFGWKGKQKRNIRWLGLCFFGAGLDMVLHYTNNGQTTSVLGMMSFLIYIMVLGFGSMKDMKRLMNIGIKAERYEKMAYHDQLTGLYNRTAFADHVGSDEFMLEKSLIVVMDLNNLKTCNDKLGHDKGDIYIRECAHMIQECFEDIGHCYRMGGDEFYVLLENGSPAICKQRLQTLKERVAKCDKVGEGFRMGIACGYKMYDRHLDYDIHETARRADKMMYQEKFAMKEL